MAVLLIKEAATKLAVLTDYISKNCDEAEEMQYSVVVIPFTGNKPISYRYGIVSPEQLISTVKMIHNRLSSVVIFGSKFLKAKAHDNCFPPFIATSNFVLNEDKCITSAFLPFSSDLASLVQLEDRSLAAKKFHNIIATTGTASTISSFKTLSGRFVTELASYFSDGVMVFMDMQYGMKIYNKSLMASVGNGLLFKHVPELNISTMYPSFRLPPILSSIMRAEHDPPVDESTADDYIIPDDDEENYEDANLDTDSSSVKDTDEKQYMPSLNEGFPFIKEDLFVERKDWFMIGDEDQYQFSQNYIIYTIRDEIIKLKKIFKAEYISIAKKDVSNYDFYEVEYE